jgi:aryl-alcohol dehydrogenase-like predicted oxidoreductase
MDHQQALERQVSLFGYHSVEKRYPLRLSADSMSRHADPEAGIKEALEQLGLDYLDLFLVHWPVSQPKAGPESFDHVTVC